MPLKWKFYFFIFVLNYRVINSLPSGISGDDDAIRLLVTVKNVRQSSSNSRMAHLAVMFSSVLSKAKSQRLHWIFLINRKDVMVVNILLQRIIISRAKVPIKVEYVNLDMIAQRFQKEIELSRKYFLNTRPLNSSRYFDEVFHIGMIYHRIFPFQRLIALDLDLKFEVDPLELFKQFNFMESESIIAVANDLAPHYWYDFRHYRQKNNGTLVGVARPGLQGFNTGVLLLDLDRMRQNKLYNSYFDEDRLNNLCEKYEFNGTLAYQDFFTLIGMEHPELFHNLHCSWNRQMDETAVVDEKFTAVFHMFHRCDGKIKIFHANGGSIMPDHDEVDTLVTENQRLINNDETIK